MDSLKVYNLFKQINDEDIVFFNMDSELCKPVDMIVTSIPVPPSCIRPTVQVSHGMKNEDDLTVKLAEIVERNKLVRSGIEDGMETHKLMEEWFLL
jgi:DNA-directed RNA polymerase III subunit RPC1